MATSKVLIVDDEQDACTSLRRILRIDGYEVDIANNIKEMLQPREWADYFAVILDRRLPDGTAEEVLPDLARRAPKAAIVIVTGYADMESSIAALREGVEDYIIKPINADVLRKTLVRINRIRKAEERALQAERLAAIGQVHTSMAHESRNFLQRIMNSTEFLEEIVEGNEEALKEVARIQKAGSGLQCLLEELRQFAAPIKLDKTESSIQSVWEAAWRDVSSASGTEHVRFDEAGDTDQKCHVDVFRLSQVFRNLFENSIAACGESPAIEVHCEQGNGTLIVRVRDNGPGLDREQQQNVFEPFFTTKSKGTGLGMAIVRRIVESHDGEIQVNPEHSDGAEFVIELPVSDV